MVSKITKERWQKCGITTVDIIELWQKIKWR